MVHNPYHWVQAPFIPPPPPQNLVNGTGNSPSPEQPTPGVVKQDKSSGGSVDTTKTRSGPQRVRMSSGERPIGAAKGKQIDTEALCQPPPPHEQVNFGSDAPVTAHYTCPGGGGGAFEPHVDRMAVLGARGSVTPEPEGLCECRCCCQGPIGGPCGTL